jgi:hypothetical protein
MHPVAALQFFQWLLLAAVTFTKHYINVLHHTALLPALPDNGAYILQATFKQLCYGRIGGLTKTDKHYSLCSNCPGTVPIVQILFLWSKYCSHCSKSIRIVQVLFSLSNAYCSQCSSTAPIGLSPLVLIRCSPSLPSPPVYVAAGRPP